MKEKNNKKLTEKEIDRIVIAQSNDNSAWSKPIRVRRKKAASFSIPPDLAARAEFLARIHRTRNTRDWLRKVIEERIELEEAAFVDVKQNLTIKS